MRHLALFLALAIPVFAADSYPRVGWQGILITEVIGATDLTPAPPENPTGPASIAGVSVNADGWTADIYIKNLSTGGSYAFGLSTNLAPEGNEKITLSVRSQGFDDSGNVTTVTRQVYGTYKVRKPYPDEATMDESVVGDTVRVKVSLSDFIFSGDSNITATITEGLYTQGGTNSLAATAVATTNLSAVAYPKVIGNWTWVPFQLVTNTMRLSAVAFHGSATNGRPVRAVKFHATDGTVSVTNIVTAMIVDTNKPDQQPFGEYVSDLNVSNMTQGALITCNFTAYPWIGDANSVLDTATTGFTFPSAYPGPLTNICDNAGTYGVTIAVVSPTGSDTSGRAANATYWATNQAPPEFLTIGGALVAIYATNNGSYGRNEIGNGIVYLKPGSYNFLGKSVSHTVGNTAWCRIEPHPDNNDWEAVITNTSAVDGRLVSELDRIKLTKIKYNSTASVHERARVWHDQCYFESATGSYIVSAAGNQMPWYLTHNTISNLNQGIISYAGHYLTVPLVRGNLFDGFRKTLATYTVVGNKTTTNQWNAGMQIVFDTSASQSYEPSRWGILYNNKFDALSTPNVNVMQCPSFFDITNGYVIAQNIFENRTNATASYSQVQGSDQLYATNGIIWNNIWIGHRTFNGYNNSGTNAMWRIAFSLKNNIFEDYNIKGDTFDTQNGNRIGNWPLMWGVGFYGNTDLATTGMGAPESFYNSGTLSGGFEGLWTYSYIARTGGTSLTNWPAFVDRKAADGVIVTMPGGGDYRFTTNSPLLNVTRQHFVLPFDINGVARTNGSPIGPYSYAQ